MDDSTLATQLLKRAESMEAEAQRLRSAAAVLLGKAVTRPDDSPIGDPVKRAAGGPGRPASTIPMLRRVLRTSGPITYRDLTQKMLDQGWVTESKLPANTVRTALGRLEERGVVKRDRDGLFSLASRGVAEGSE